MSALIPDAASSRFTAKLTLSRYGRLGEINRGIRVGDVKSKEMYAKQYHTLMDAAIRNYCTDVTS